MTMDDDGRMYLNGIPTNETNPQGNTPRETEVFQTPPLTPRQQLLEEEDDGVIYLNRILPIDPAYEDSLEFLSCGKPKPPHDFDQETLMHRRVPVTTVAIRWILQKITSTLETNLSILPST